LGDPFWASGLRFSCARCSACCRGGPGFVFLSREDLRRLLDFLGIDLRSFFGKYCTLKDRGDGMALSLAEKPGYDCIFWEGGGCSVYDVRPVQCSTYPFWAALLQSPGSWREESRNCPGIGNGQLRSREHIEARIYARRAERTIVLPYGSLAETLDEDTILGR